MAWRIDEAVIRGELDNRTRGRVTGRLWLVGRAEPVELALEGNCWRDLAGRRLEFTNPAPRPGDTAALATRQEGVVGDITASRKVKVPEVPLDQLHLYYKTGREMPWHWGNALYLEWQSDRNGRVVIETATFDLRIVGEPAWEMSAEEETAQRAANSAALTAFWERLAGAAPANPEAFEDQEWNERTQTEEEAEEQYERGERLADRIEARLAREGPDADYEKILEEEIERMQRERGETAATPEQLARRAEWLEELEQAVDETPLQPEGGGEEEPEEEHPLVERVIAFSLQLRATAKAEGWLPEKHTQEHPVAELLDATMIAGPKLAGALNGEEWPPPLAFCAHTLVRLKRARGYLEDAQRAAESCDEEKLIKPAHLGPILVELIDLGREIDSLIAELREKLGRGPE